LSLIESRRDEVISMFREVGEYGSIAETKAEREIRAELRKDS